MVNTTNVPSPSFGDQGFTAPPESLILSGVQQDINSAFGGNLNPGLSTPQGQLASTETAIIGDANAVFLWFCNQVDPAFSSGRMQDGIARIYFISRIPGAPTVQLCACLGLQNTVIPVGALAQDTNGGLWVAQQGGTVPASGTISLNFAFSENGPTPGPLSLNIYQAIFGWDTITPIGAAALGINVESRSEFELRRSRSTAINSTGQLPAILGSVLAVQDVLDVFAVENYAPTKAVIGGVSVNPKSIYVCVLGGDSTAIARAIWSRKAPGCGYTGNTTVVITDPNPSYNPPLPSYYVTFQIPTIVNFVVTVTLKNNKYIPNNALTLIQNTIISAFAGTDGGPRAKIGSLVLASRYYAGVMALGVWAEIIQIQVGADGFGALIAGSINNSILTVTSISSGNLAVGQVLRGSGIVNQTTITAFLSG